MLSTSDLSNTIRSRTAEFHEYVKESNWHLNLLVMVPSSTLLINVPVTMMVTVGIKPVGLVLVQMWYHWNESNGIFFYQAQLRAIFWSSNLKCRYIMYGVSGQLFCGTHAGGSLRCCPIPSTRFQTNWKGQNEKEKKRKKKRQKCKTTLPPEKKKKKLNPLEPCKNNRKFILN